MLYKMYHLTITHSKLLLLQKLWILYQEVG